MPVNENATCRVDYEIYTDGSMKIRINKKCTPQEKLEILTQINQSKDAIRKMLAKEPTKEQFSKFFRSILDKPPSDSPLEM